MTLVEQIGQAAGPEARLRLTFLVMVQRYRAALFDLLTALLDSWSLWNAVAGGATAGRRWRRRYLELTYGAGNYRPYETLVAEAAASVGLPSAAPAALLERWDCLAPWPEVPGVLRILAERMAIGIVTNCSEVLGQRAVARLGVPVPIVVTAEAAGAYKPDPRPYERGVRELGVPAERVLFVAGSPFDIPGAAGAGLPVVWHNRLGLTRLPRSPAPLAELATLDPLPSWLELHESV
jgi:2-haloacid dehalogenase